MLVAMVCSFLFNGGLCHFLLQDLFLYILLKDLFLYIRHAVKADTALLALMFAEFATNARC